MKQHSAGYVDPECLQSDRERPYNVSVNDRSVAMAMKGKGGKGKGGGGKKGC